VTQLLLAIAQRDPLERPPNNVACKSTRPVFDDHASLDRHCRIRRSATILVKFVEYVSGASGWHPSSVAEETNVLVASSSDEWRVNSVFGNYVV
tara:strand:+ start:185 stop:466 length:282 start_codon:yes stop_codon:yes gene_type:complete